MECIELQTVPDDCRQLAVAGGVFLQDPEWGDFQVSLGRTVRRFVVRDEDETVLLYAQCIEQGVGKKSFLFAPYGPLFAEDLSEVQRSGVFDFFTSELHARFTGLMFFRFEPANAMTDLHVQSKIKKTIDLNPHQTLLLDLQQPLDDLLAAMKPKTRYNIRLAEKSGIDVRVLQELPVTTKGGDDPITASAKRAGIRAYNRAYFNDLLKFFSNPEGAIQAKWYAAYHEGDLLAAAIMLEYGGQMTYLFGGAIALKRNLMPSYAIHYQAIQDAQAHGLSTYDFWGVETDERHPWYGFSKFKLGFGGRVVQRPGTLDFVYNGAWYNGYALLRKLNRLKNLRFRH
jgi:lipid II:glycine glycyltransferase (peptidoglycan interpeptide bridge formation enzyme)